MALNSTFFCVILLMSAFVTRVSGSCSSYECLRKRNERIYGGVGSERNSRPFQQPINGSLLSAGFLSEKDPPCWPNANWQTSHTFENIMMNSQVALILRVGAEGEIGFCGGSLIHPQWVLSAAHCCFHDDQLITHGQAVLGAHSLYDRFENGRRMINLVEIVVHPDWDPITYANDLALLKLANFVQMSATIDIIRLPYLDTVTWSFAGDGVTASGWGIAAEGVTFISPTLREKPMTVLTDDLCNTTYMEHLPENIICAFSTTSAGTCKGDNGGPLALFFTRSEEIILLGVASFVEADGCTNRNPSVFTRVQRYLPWISDVTHITLD